MCDMIVNAKTAGNFNFVLSNLRQQFGKKSKGK